MARIIQKRPPLTAARPTISGVAILNQIDWWPNWPIMGAQCLQGNSATTILDYSTHSALADKDVVIIQAFFPTTTRIQNRVNAISDVWSLRAAAPKTKFFPHSIPSIADKNYPASPGQGEEEVTKELIEHPTKGNERWYIHVTGNITPAGRVEDFFDEPNLWATNIGAKVTDVNSLGETFATAYYKEWDTRYHIGADDVRPYLSGFMQDNSTPRPLTYTQNDGTTDVTNNVDFNYDGVPEVRNSWNGSSTAGGSQYAAGQLRFKASMEARFPGWVMIPNAAEWDFNYFDGFGFPPLPMNLHPFYRGWEVILDEVANNQLGLKLLSTTGYQWTGGGNTSSYYRACHIMEKFLKLDVNIPAFIGKGAVLVHGNGQNRTPVANDIEFIRTLSLMPLLMPRHAPCVQQGGARPFSLDELLVDLGNPLVARSMGTLNETTLSWALKAPNLTVGAGEFYWVEFERGLVIGNLADPTVGTWPNAADAAVTCPLTGASGSPAPGAGFKWQNPNGATYVNPLTGRAMRNQSPALNNGADVTSVALKPLHLRIILRVPV